MGGEVLQGHLQSGWIRAGPAGERGHRRLADRPHPLLRRGDTRGRPAGGRGHGMLDVAPDLGAGADWGWGQLWEEPWANEGGVGSARGGATEC